MPKTSTWRFQVRSYELGPSAQVGPATFLHYIEEGSWQASLSGGFGYDWYRQNNRIWVVRKMTIRYYASVTFGEELELKTWISDYRRVQVYREYDVRRVSDGQPLVRARANWVYMNAETMQPARLPDEIMAEFQPTGEVETLDTSVPDSISIEEPLIHTDEHRVQYYELDSAGHVNNSVYLFWAEQALINALRTAGWPPERLNSSDFTTHPLASEIEYFRSALDDEPVWIVTQLAAVGRDRAAWRIDARHGATGELMAKVTIVRAFKDAQGARSIPDALHLALVQRTRTQKET
jgi:acyl-CoA thioester hydrolase